MALNLEGLTEDQIAEINAEIDRERTRASETARKNAQKEQDRLITERVAAALEEERKRLEMSEAEKVAEERKKIAEAAAEVARSRKELAATKKLLAANYTDEQVEALLPVLALVDDAQFDVTVDTFIAMNDGIIKNKVDAERQNLLKNATPPASQSGAPVDANTAANAALESGDIAGSIDIMLGAAATTPA